MPPCRSLDLPTAVIGKAGLIEHGIHEESESTWTQVTVRWHVAVGNAGIHGGKQYRPSHSLWIAGRDYECLHFVVSLIEIAG